MRKIQTLLMAGALAATMVGTAGQDAQAKPSQAAQIRKLERLVKKQQRQLRSLSATVRSVRTTANNAADGVAFYDVCLLVQPSGVDTVLQSTTNVDFLTPLFSPVFVDVMTAGGPNFAVMADPSCVAAPTPAAARGFRKLARR